MLLKAAMLICFLLGSLSTMKAQEPPRLMPLPSVVQPSEGFLVVDSSFSISLTGYQDPLLNSAALRLVKNLSAKTGLNLDGGVAREGKPATLQIQCDAADPNFLTPKADESYMLDVTPQGAKLHAHGPAGVLRGLATFFQLVRIDSVGFRAPAVKIQDQPRFAWRGLMLDVSRHFLTIETLRHNLDAMELVKMNVLELHLSDAEAFRVESKLYPRLQQMGSGGRYYTQQEIRDLVAYARDRGIRILPEFDVPGHCKALLVAYPELAAAPGPYQLGPDLNVMNATLDPSREEVYQFLDRLLGEMAALFPDRYFHSGGDEVNGAQWAQNPRIQAFMKTHNFKGKQDLQGYFTERVRQILARHGKTMMSWDEVLQPGLDRNVVIQAWRSSKMVQKSAALGHPTIVSAGYYLNFELPAADHYAVNPWDSRAQGTRKEAVQMVKGTPLEAYVTRDNVASDSPLLTPEEEQHVRGGIACLWSEFVWDDKQEMEAWPRAAAVAERLWSPASTKDVDSMYRRLAGVDVDLEFLGVRHHSEEAVMLQRLAGDHNAAPLAILAEAVEPIKNLARFAPRIKVAMTTGKGIDSTAVSSRFVDAIPPESLVARRFIENIHRMLAAGTNSENLRRSVQAKLTEWRDNDAKFQALARYSFLLQEVIPASQDLKELAEAGLEALTMWESGQTPSAEWKEKENALLEKHRKVRAACADSLLAMMSPQPPDELMNVIAPAVEELVTAAGNPR